MTTSSSSKRSGNERGRWNDIIQPFVTVSNLCHKNNNNNNSTENRTNDVGGDGEDRDGECRSTKMQRQRRRRRRQHVRREASLKAIRQQQQQQQQQQTDRTQPTIGTVATPVIVDTTTKTKKKTTIRCILNLVKQLQHGRDGRNESSKTSSSDSHQNKDITVVDDTLESPLLDDDDDDDDDDDGSEYIPRQYPDIQRLLSLTAKKRDVCTQTSFSLTQEQKRTWEKDHAKTMTTEAVSEPVSKSTESRETKSATKPKTEKTVRVTAPDSEGEQEVKRQPPIVVPPPQIFIEGLNLVETGRGTRTCHVVHDNFSDRKTQSVRGQHAECVASVSPNTSQHRTDTRRNKMSLPTNLPLGDNNDETEYASHDLTDHTSSDRNTKMWHNNQHIRPQVSIIDDQHQSSSAFSFATPQKNKTSRGHRRSRSSSEGRGHESTSTNKGDSKHSNGDDRIRDLYLSQIRRGRRRDRNVTDSKSTTTGQDDLSPRTTSPSKSGSRANERLQHDDNRHTNIERNQRENFKGNEDTTTVVSSLKHRQTRIHSESEQIASTRREFSPSWKTQSNIRDMLAMSEGLPVGLPSPLKRSDEKNITTSKPQNSHFFDLTVDKSLFYGKKPDDSKFLSPLRGATGGGTAKSSSPSRKSNNNSGIGSPGLVTRNIIHMDQLLYTSPKLFQSTYKSPLEQMSLMQTSHNEIHSTLPASDNSTEHTFQRTPSSRRRDHISIDRHLRTHSHSPEDRKRRIKTLDTNHFLRSHHSQMTTGSFSRNGSASLSSSSRLRYCSDREDVPQTPSKHREYDRRGVRPNRSPSMVYNDVPRTPSTRRDYCNNYRSKTPRTPSTSSKRHESPYRRDESLQTLSSRVRRENDPTNRPTPFFKNDTTSKSRSSSRERDEQATRHRGRHVSNGSVTENSCLNDSIFQRYDDNCENIKTNTAPQSSAVRSRDLEKLSVETKRTMTPQISTRELIKQFDQHKNAKHEETRSKSKFGKSFNDDRLESCLQSVPSNERRAGKGPGKALVHSGADSTAESATCESSKES